MGVEDGNFHLQKAMPTQDAKKYTSSNTAHSFAKDNINIPGLYPNQNSPRKLGSIESFIIAAVAPAIAVVFTNPFDTAKERLQLQGQSSAASAVCCKFPFNNHISYIALQKLI